jgi:hypothetical protein
MTAYRLTAGLLRTYAVVFVVLGALVLGELPLGIGHVGHEQLRARQLGGVIAFVAVLGVGALILRAAAGLVGSADPATGDVARRLVLAILGPLLLFGTIGEVIDIAGTSSTGSNLIGLLILVLAGLPVALLATAGADRPDRVVRARRVRR